jgi:flavin reductase (DIM6/NTAB) family NADH-FMN oxidoreductase RutF
LVLLIGKGLLEATPRIELGMELLQSSALPLGYVASALDQRDSTLGWLRLQYVLEAFREALAAVPAAVTVVSSGGTRGFRALAASSFTPVSLEPPLVLVCLESVTQTREAVAASGRFNVSVLERGQEFLAERFAGRAPLVDPWWRGVPHRLGENGLPLLEGSVAWFECELQRLDPGGDHDIALGKVTASGRLPGEPLVLWDRGFWRLG